MTELEFFVEGDTRRRSMMRKARGTDYGVWSGASSSFHYAKTRPEKIRVSLGYLSTIGSYIGS